jgi:enterochelin esterase family protein
VVLTLALLLSATGLRADEAAGADPPRPFASLGELDTALARLADSGDAEAFWRRATAGGALPLVFGDTAVFLYRGAAESVDWRGDFNGWGSDGPLAGRRLGGSDLWHARLTLRPASRLDYKIVVDGVWQLDPLNPHQQVGGYGPNSELRMPGWSPPAFAERRPDGPRGRFTDDLWLDSEILGYAVRYRVWTPPGWSAGDGESEEGAAPRRLPVLYVTDGSDYWRDEMGSLVVSLDNLSADGRIPPLLAVFVDPWDEARETNRREEQLVPDDAGRCTFCRFLATELIPSIDAAYPTSGAAGRALLGTSYGGLHAVYVGLRHPGLFTALGIQSPALHPAPWLLDELAAAETFPHRAFLSIGAYESGGLDDTHRLRDLLRARGTELLYRQPPDGHSWGNWRAQMDELLPWLFPPGGDGR